jgi:hypothetical protein
MGNVSVAPAFAGGGAAIPRANGSPKPAAPSNVRRESEIVMQRSYLRPREILHEKDVSPQPESLQLLSPAGKALSLR